MSFWGLSANRGCCNCCRFTEHWMLLILGFEKGSKCMVGLKNSPSIVHCLGWSYNDPCLRFLFARDMYPRFIPTSGILGRQRGFLSAGGLCFEGKLDRSYLALSNHLAGVFLFVFSPLTWGRWTSLIFFWHDETPTRLRPFSQRCRVVTETAGNLKTSTLSICQEHCSLRAWSKTLAFLWSVTFAPGFGTLPATRETKRIISLSVDVAIGSMHLGLV